MNLRPYQAEAVQAVYNALRARNDNPCVVLPTGTGKSLVIAQIVSDAVSRWQGRILILAHVKELLEQNADKIRRLCPSIEIGIYSAGLRSREKTQPCIVAGIQSVYQRACELGSFNLVIVDECHLIPVAGDGMYRQFLAEARIVNPKLRTIGLTATPYRLSGGLICKPENALNSICYEAHLKDMIAEGWLSPLRSRAGSARADFSGLHVRGGEFIEGEIAELMDTDALVESACSEIVELTQERKSVLVFCSSVAHAGHVARAITRIAGQECAIITGETSKNERAETIARFRGDSGGDLFAERKPLKYLANVNVLTTGFDAPGVDCIALLRPTASAGLYVQMVGRGTRLADGKKNCMVLDYGGNVLRLGPVDAIKVTDKAPSGQGGEAPAKECPQCHELVHAAVRLCEACGYEFPEPEIRHDARASDASILSGEVTVAEYEVAEALYFVHTKRGADENTPKTMRIEYRISLTDSVSEWICPEHTGWARERFEKWWKARSHWDLPDSAQMAVDLANVGALAITRRITVRSVSGEKFPRITKYDIGDKPVELNKPAMAAVDDYADELPF